MQELIQITQEVIGNTEVNSVNARDLWKALGIKKDFSEWTKRQINTLGLEINVDYVLLPQKGEQRKRGGHNAIDYIITLNTAKHISMASRTAKGKEVRDYFISCERKLLAKTNPSEVLAVVVSQNETMLQLLQTQTKLLEQLVNKEDTRQKTITKEQMQKIRSKQYFIASIIQEVHPYLDINKILKNIYTQLNARFGVNSYYDIAEADFDDAMDLLERATEKWEERREIYHKNPKEYTPATWVL